jgi:sodium-independent sulfate anion transporter 11
VRAQLDRYAAPESVEWHFASINSRWTKRALTTAGFGYIDRERFAARQHWNPVYSYAPLDTPAPKLSDPEAQDEIHSVGNKGFPAGKVTTVHGQNRPFFHIDVAAAVESAIVGVDTKLAHISAGSSQDVVGTSTYQAKHE